MNNKDKESEMIKFSISPIPPKPTDPLYNTLIIFNNNFHVPIPIVRGSENTNQCFSLV